MSVAKTMLALNSNCLHGEPRWRQRAELNCGRVRRQRDGTSRGHQRNPQLQTDKDWKGNSVVPRARDQTRQLRETSPLRITRKQHLPRCKTTLWQNKCSSYIFNNQHQIQNQLELYTHLINVPKCWAVIQPLLCATFMPKCETVLGQDMVYLPSFEMCNVTMEPCAILYNTSYFPSYLKCNETLFPPKCDNAAREMKFNTTGRCLPPLIHTEKAFHFYKGECMRCYFWLCGE